MTWRWTDRVALGCFTAVLVAMALFHVLPVSSHRWGGGTGWQHYYGWEIWDEWWDGVKDFDEVNFKWPDAPIWAALHLAFLMFLASPFVIRILGSNRLIWWLFSVMSLMTMMGLTLVLGWVVLRDFDVANERIGAGFWLLMASPVLHFIGVLFVRRRRVGSGAFQAP